jgi:hypothetical protein
VYEPTNSVQFTNAEFQGRRQNVWQKARRAVTRVRELEMDTPTPFLPTETGWLT